MDELEERCYQLKQRIGLLKRRIASAKGVSKTSDKVREVREKDITELSKTNGQDIVSGRVSPSELHRTSTQGTSSNEKVGARKSSDNSNEDIAREKAINRLLSAIDKN